MSEYLEYGGLEEATKDLRKKVSDFFSTDFNVLYDALLEAYEQGVSDTREQIAQDIEGHLEKNIDLQPWIDIRNFRFCANIARGKK
jgi:archaellum component FlaC